MKIMRYPRALVALLNKTGGGQAHSKSRAQIAFKSPLQRFVRRSLVGLICIILSLIALEIFSRVVLGLGDPPLAVPDASIDYIFAPNQDCKRFGNRVVYNSVSMRADRDILPRAESKRRFIVCGDSVVNGGSLTTHSDLATALLDCEMNKLGLGDAWNISAGSWGPMNVANYFKKFGFFDATDIVLLVSSHDLFEDDPVEGKGKIVGTHKSFPKTKPLFAFQEGISRYLYPKIAKVFIKEKSSKKLAKKDALNDVVNESAKKNLEACSFLYNIPNARKYLVLHRSRSECRRYLGNGEVPSGEIGFTRHAQEHNIPVFLLDLDINSDYRDEIHINESGQRKLFELLRHILKESVELKVQ